VGGNEAVRLLVGVIPILIVAGTIEGFFSPSEVPTAFKFLLSAGIFTVFALYLVRGGRGYATPQTGPDATPTLSR